MTYSVFGSLGD